MNLRAIGLDVGNGYVKALSSTQQASFPSVISRAHSARFRSGMGERSGDVRIQTAAGDYYVGDAAQRLSPTHVQRLGRNRLMDGYYNVLFQAALSQVLGNSTNVRVVTGLPVSWYTPENKRRVTTAVQGSHEVTCDGRTSRYNVLGHRVVPEPFGALMCEFLNKSGSIADEDLGRQSVGVIDVGTQTTNFALFRGLEYIDHQSASLEVGLGMIQSWIREDLADRHGLTLSLYEADQVMRSGSVMAYGEKIEVDAIEAIIELQVNVGAMMTQLWNTAADVDVILLSGGGAQLVSDVWPNQDRHPGMRVVKAGAFANVEGFYRWAQREDVW